MKDLLTALIGYFLRGLLFMAPIGVTVAIISWFVRFLNDLISPLTEDVLPFHVPGLGFLLVFVVLAMLGFIASHLISISAMTWVDRLMGRTPLVKVIYFSVKDIISLFSDKQEKLGRPVKVRVLRDPIQYRFGFVTQSDLSAFGFGEEMISVYLPLSYGIVGNQMVVHRDDVEFLDLPTTEEMKFIVSGGVTHVEGKAKEGI
ncbi:MAG: DUF502 domain-containing protein [Flavobacteriales bacterium]|nr:DUF502 domain-containing protein [Flavobacteriales bacterium]